MKRLAVMIVTSAVLWALVAQVNHALTGLHTTLFVGGLFVTYSALCLPLRVGLLASACAGLILDAESHVATGTFLALFSVAHSVVYNIRGRLPRDDTTAQVLVALFTNLGLFLALCFIEIGHEPILAENWPRLFWDLAASQVFVAATCPWFIAFQEKSLILAGEDPAHIY